ncbi:unnamed protein product [Cochlearia groenlandica]
MPKLDGFGFIKVSFKLIRVRKQWFSSTTFGLNKDLKEQLNQKHHVARFSIYAHYDSVLIGMFLKGTWIQHVSSLIKRQRIMVLFLRGALIHQDLKGFNHSDLGHSFPPLDLCVYKQEIRRKRLKISGSNLPRSSRADALIPCLKITLWRRRLCGRFGEIKCLESLRDLVTSIL